MRNIFIYFLKSSIPICTHFIGWYFASRFFFKFSCFVRTYDFRIECQLASELFCLFFRSAREERPGEKLPSGPSPRKRRLRNCVRWNPNQGPFTGKWTSLVGLLFLLRFYLFLTGKYYNLIFKNHSFPTVIVSFLITDILPSSTRPFGGLHLVFLYGVTGRSKS